MGQGGAGLPGASRGPADGINSALGKAIRGARVSGRAAAAAAAAPPVQLMGRAGAGSRSGRGSG